MKVLFVLLLMILFVGQGHAYQYENKIRAHRVERINDGSFRLSEFTYRLSNRFHYLTVARAISPTYLCKKLGYQGVHPQAPKWSLTTNRSYVYSVICVRKGYRISMR